MTQACVVYLGLHRAATYARVVPVVHQVDGSTKLRPSVSSAYVLTAYRLLAVTIAWCVATPAAAQPWEQPPRSQANLDALARVELKHYTFAEAGDKEQEYRLYVPTGYDGNTATPLVVALHGLGSGTMYMMEYNNLVEEAERHGFMVATPMGYNERGWYGARGQGNEFNRRQEDPGPASRPGWPWPCASDSSLDVRCGR